METNDMPYRKLYEKHHGVIIEPGYEIHHIDGNHSNNTIENLLCVTTEQHLEIHKKQKDWGAVQAILMRLENKEDISEVASKFQQQLLEKGTHNFQTMSKERRSEISKNTHKTRGTAFLGIKDTVENSRNAGKKAAELKAGFLNTNSNNHGSKHVKGTCWWVNPEGKRKRAATQPGPEWQQGMKYES
jgi:hypothetical protein